MPEGATRRVNPLGQPRPYPLDGGIPFVATSMPRVTERSYSGLLDNDGVKSAWAQAFVRCLGEGASPLTRFSRDSKKDSPPHVKAFWIATGLEVAQTSLWFGVDDLDGTVQEERIYHMAGAPTPETMTPQQISTLIRDAGRHPVERDTLYNVVSNRVQTPPSHLPA